MTKQLYLLPLWGQVWHHFHIHTYPQDPSKDRVLIGVCIVIPVCLLSLSGNGDGLGKSLGLLIPESPGLCTGPMGGSG